MDKKTKAAISGYYGFDNFGDEAILSALVGELKKNDIDITVFSKNPAKTSENLKVMSVNSFDIKKLLEVLKNTDVLISGGGSLLQDATSLKSLLYYIFVISAALHYKKKVIIFAQGIGPIKNIIGQILTKSVLKKCSYITVRDEKSLFRVRGWGAKADLVNDPVWGMELPPAIPMGRVGVQLRNWKGLNSKYLFTLARQIALNFSDKEIYIYSFQDAFDLEICKKFEGNLKLANPAIKTKILSGLNIDSVAKSFSNLDFLIGMRYHACLLALKYGIRTFALSYDEKVEKLARRFEIPCSNLNDAESIEEKMDKLKKLDPKELKTKADAAVFDFSNILKAIKSQNKD